MSATIEEIREAFDLVAHEGYEPGCHPNDLTDEGYAAHGVLRDAVDELEALRKRVVLLEKVAEVARDVLPRYRLNRDNESLLQSALDALDAK